MIVNDRTSTKTTQRNGGLRAAVCAALALLMGCGEADPSAGEAEGVIAQRADALESACSVTPPADVTTGTCRVDTTVTVGVATASGCGSPAPLTGEVILRNGVPLNPPTPVVNGRVALAAGTNTVLWFLTADRSVSAIQTVVVNPGLLSGQSFQVGARASVGVITGSQSGPAGLFNAGAGPTSIGSDSFAGGVVSIGPVSVLDRAALSGGILSAGAVTVAPSASVAGPVTPFGSFILPGLPALPSFPAPAGGNVNVNSGVARALAPNSYASVNVSSGGTLVLAAGDYFFRSLIVNSGAVVTVAAAPPGSANSATRVFVSNQLVLSGPLQGPGGNSLIPTIVGYSGSGLLSLNNNFIGTFVAPNAELSLGAGGPRQFIGAFYARVLRVNNDSQVLCNFLSAVGGQL